MSDKIKKPYPIDSIHKITHFILDLIAIVTALASFIIFILGHGTIFFLMFCCAAIWFICIYFYFKKDEIGEDFGVPKIKRPRFAPKHRKTALCFIIIMPIIVAALLLNVTTSPIAKFPILLLNISIIDDQIKSDVKITHKIMANLNKYIRYCFNKNEVEIKHLDISLTELNGGSKKAREIGSDKKSIIVIWGYYEAVSEEIEGQISFEVLKDIKYLAISQKSKEIFMSVADFKNFKTYSKISKEVTYLTFLTIGLIYYESQQYEKAIKLFEKTIEMATSDKDSATIYSYWGNAHLFIAEFDSAIYKYNQAIQKDKRRAEVYNNRGNAYYLKSGKNINVKDRNSYRRNALSNYNNAINLNPDDKSAYSNRGNLYILMDKPVAAIADFTTTIKLDPNNGISYYNRGIAYQQLTNNHKKLQCYADSANADLESAIKKLSFKMDEEKNNPNCYFYRACAYLASGDTNTAINDLNHTIKYESRYYNAYKLRREIYKKMGMYKKAKIDSFYVAELKGQKPYLEEEIVPPPSDEKDLIKRPQIIPHFDMKKNIQDYINDAKKYFSKGYYDSAVNELKKAIKIDSSEAKLYFFRGEIYFEMSEYKLAISDFNRAIRIDSTIVAVYMKRGKAYFEESDYDSAITDFTRFLDFENDNTNKEEALYCRGVGYFKKGSYNLAIYDFEKVIKTNPFYKKVKDYLRKAQSKIKNRNNEAVDTLKSVQTIEPPKPETPPIIKKQLRSKFTNLSFKAVKAILTKYDYYCKDENCTKHYSNPTGKGFDNYFELQKNGQVVYDRATGLIWQQSGSSKSMTYEEAEKYIKQLNQKRFAGYNDWRLPTLEEVMSLVERNKNKYELYIDAVFDNKHWCIWTDDIVKGKKLSWVVLFNNGMCANNKDIIGLSTFFVRAVRSDE